MKRQWSKEDGVDDAEHRGACADTEGEGEDGSDSEAAGFRELTKSKAEIIHGGAGLTDGSDAWGSATWLVEKLRGENSDKRIAEFERAEWLSIFRCE
jgi:hypothetical protein